MEMKTTCASQDEYIETIGRALYSSLSLRDFPCQDVERRNKPEIEFGDCPELLLRPRRITLKGAQEQCFIEPSINSTRISFVFRRGDDLDGLLATSMYKFLGMKADHHLLLRRSPVDSYDVSFLVTSELLQQHGPINIILSILKFAVDVPQFLSVLTCKVMDRLEENVKQSVYGLCAIYRCTEFAWSVVRQMSTVVDQIYSGATLTFTSILSDLCARSSNNFSVK